MVYGGVKGRKGALFPRKGALLGALLVKFSLLLLVSLRLIQYA